MYQYFYYNIDIDFVISKTIDISIFRGKNRYRIELEIADIVHHYLSHIKAFVNRSNA